MSNFLVFAGTTEGRRMVELLYQRGAEVCASVATEHGRELLPPGVKVFAHRLEADEMASLLSSLNFDCVIDATHPYAAQVTENVKAACAYADVRYLRLLRPETGEAGGCVFAETPQKAAEVLAVTKGKVLLTTGSKELEIFTSIPDFQNRLYPRVLPALDSIGNCLNLGYPMQNIIAMQGPFTRELNGATMRQIGASILVTKESGQTGGFLDKLAAAKDVGATVVVIGRPREEAGYSFDEMAALLEREYGLAPQEKKKATLPCFPLFVRLEGKRLLVVGGGNIAYRRARTLLDFCENVTVVSPQLDPRFEETRAKLVKRSFMHGDCAEYDMVFAATNNREVNRAVYDEARRLKVPVNVSDAPEECDFYFPGIARHENLVAGITASGKDHKLVKSVSAAIREILPRIKPEKPGKEETEI